MSQQDILKRLISSAEQLKTDFPLPANLNSQTSTTLLLQKVPPLRLAKLESIFRSEMTRNRISPRISKIVLSRASELGASCQEYYDQACRGLLALPVYPDDPPITTLIEKLRLAFEHRYDLKGLSQLMREALSAQVVHCNSCDEWPVSAESKQRRSFNHNYTPLLEKYFEHNAYPSVPDRLVLARKSMMTPRQIEVWFQNHRNRAKKDGKVLKRWKSSSPAFDISFEALNHQMPQFSVPDNDRNEMLDDLSDDDDDSANENQDTAQITNESNNFKFSAAPHAFPTKYPPNCVEDPFPNKDGVFKFCPPNWRRRPATTALQHKTLSIDELTVHFASKLNLREGGDKGYNAKNNHCNKRSQPWFAATVTIPCPAPHPALMKLPIRRTSAPLSPLTLAVPALHSQSSTPQSRTIVPASLSSSPIQSKCAPRKIACLPRRTPSSLVSFGTTSSSSSSHASPTRTSSFSSVASSGSSLSDSSSIDPITPPSSPNMQLGGVILSEEVFPGYLQAQHPLDKIAAHHMDSSACDTIAKHIPFSQHEIKSLLTMPHTHYLLAQS